MENTTAAPAKKTWQKPNFYLLDSGTVESGTFTFIHEVNNGNATKIKTQMGVITTNPGAYPIAIHS